MLQYDSTGRGTGTRLGMRLQVRQLWSQASARVRCLERPCPSSVPSHSGNEAQAVANDFLLSNSADNFVMNMVRNASFHGTCVIQCTSLPVAPLGMFARCSRLDILGSETYTICTQCTCYYGDAHMHLVVYVHTLMLTHTCTCTHTYIQVLHVHTHGQH